MNEKSADICIIGGGSGGLSVAAGAAQMGAKVILFEGGKMGGDCLNYGCVPSKALLAAGKAAHYAEGHADMGVNGKPMINFARAKDHVESVIAGIAPHDSPERFRSLGVDVIESYAGFADGKTVEGGGVRVRAKYFVISTGSSAFIPPIPGLNETPFHTNETIFEDRECPVHLVVIGGGPIGVEMALAHARLGCKVTLIEAAPAIMIRDDKALVDILRGRLKDEGVNLIEGAGVTGVSGKKGAITVNVDGQSPVKGSHLLVAVGRKPNLDKLNLEAAGIKTTERGAIITDRRLKTSNRRIFAIGDAAGRQQFTHIAGYHAGIVIRNALFRVPAKISDAAVPWVTYTDPELAHVGMTEAEAQGKGINCKRIEAEFAENDRARAEHRTEGKVVAITGKGGKILGASILAPNAGELIQTWTLAINSGLKIGAVASYIAPYPTMGEANKRAAGSYYTPTLFSDRTRRIVRMLLKLPF